MFSRARAVSVACSIASLKRQKICTVVFVLLSEISFFITVNIAS